MYEHVSRLSRIFPLCKKSSPSLIRFSACQSLPLSILD